MKCAFLTPSIYVDSDHPTIVSLADELVGHITDEKEKAVKLYFYVRDTFRYDPYRIDLREDALKASDLLNRESGYCGEKACLLAALARAAEIPSRLGFAKVTNHIGTKRLEELLQTNELVFHGFTELFIENAWVKCTPAFNATLCAKLGVDPLDFNGTDDSVFQQYDKGGAKYMEYTHFYGSFVDIPRDFMLAELKKYYPHIFEMKGLVTENAYFLVE